MSYVDTKIIECSRASSEQQKGNNMDNPALFTNKLGESIKLNVGDVISVERSFVNGLGSGNQKTIQFKGQVIPQTPPTITTTPNKVKTISYSRISFSNKNTDPTTSPYRMGHYLHYSSETSTQTITLKDNSQVFTIGYFISGNQYPTYIQLPRRFNGIRQGVPVGQIMATKDSHSLGGTQYGPQIETKCSADWREYIDSTAHTLLKQRTNNSRYTLFVRDEAYFDETIAGAKTYLPTGENIKHPLYKDYIKYTERKEINIEKGFNTPDEIADQITRQLNKSSDPEPFRFEGTDNKIQIISQTTTGETYKPFICPSAEDFGSANFTKYLNGDQDDEAMNYFNSYFYIGVKRPDLWIQGRSIPQNPIDNTAKYRGMSITQDLNKADPAHYFYTDMPYTRENLQYWVDLFEIQQLYPELWENLDETIYNQFAPNLPTQNSTGILHMNRWGSNALYMSPGNTIQPAFGSDGLDNSAVPAGLFNLSTLALFMYYNRDDREIYYEPESIPDDFWSMGWARPYLDGGVYKIYFTQYQNGGVPDDFFSEKNSLGVDEEAIRIGRPVGYDWNSTAYGTACVIPYAGYTWTSMEDYIHPTQYQRFSTSMKNITGGGSTSIVPALTQVYIGANNPTLQFNQFTNRFEFTKLHTEENVGNVWDAGDSVGRTPAHPVPVNPNESDVCYKINPFVNPYGFSPNFLPYLLGKEVSFLKPEEPANTLFPREFFEVNENIEKYSIFDAHGGIYFDDFGVNEREWAQTIWGIMGFSYEQFNSPATAENRFTKRVNFDNKYSLSKPTTNSEIDTTDNKTWSVNIYGTPQYTNQVPSPFLIQPYTKPAGVITPGTTFSTCPAITQSCQSIVLSAQNLSKQMLNPFYTIRSDLITESKYLGGKDSGIQMPVVGIVDRYGAEGDFYFGSPSDISFTITKETVLSDITTSIHDPDGTFAVINDNSGVIYKIERQRPAPPQIIQEILKEEKKKK